MYANESEVSGNHLGFAVMYSKRVSALFDGSNPGGETCMNHDAFLPINWTGRAVGNYHVITELERAGPLHICGPETLFPIANCGSSGVQLPYRQLDKAPFQTWKKQIAPLRRPCLIQCRT